RNLVISAAGNVEHARFVELVEHYFGNLVDRPVDLTSSAPVPATSRVVISKDLEQAHLMMGTPCPSMMSKDRYAVHTLNVILGGGMSSRLFQTIREDHGLAYAVFSGVNAYTDAGYLQRQAQLIFGEELAVTAIGQIESLEINQ